jgi:hypothetical protein
LYIFQRKEEKRGKKGKEERKKESWIKIVAESKINKKKQSFCQL